MSQPSAPFSASEQEQDDRYPSGPWEGYYLQPGSSGRFEMELILSFQNGKIQGEGRDVVGEFLMHGSYEKDSGKCWWSKQYVGKHGVAYSGYNEGQGIWGVWEIYSTYKGGFHIWPLGHGSFDGKAVSESVDRPIELVM